MAPGPCSSNMVLLCLEGLKPGFVGLRIAACFGGLPDGPSLNCERDVLLCVHLNHLVESLVQSFATRGPCAAEGPNATDTKLEGISSLSLILG